MLSPYLPDGDEQDPLRRWPIGRDADTPAPDLNAAGCEHPPLQTVAGVLLGCVRSYDLIIRPGDSSFAVALCGAAIAEARARFGAVQQALGGDGIAISVGCAELAARDAAGLIDCAGADRRSSGERDPAPVDAEIGAQPC